MIPCYVGPGAVRVFVLDTRAFISIYSFYGLMVKFFQEGRSGAKMTTNDDTNRAVSSQINSLGRFYPVQGGCKVAQGGWKAGAIWVQGEVEAASTRPRPI